MEYPTEQEYAEAFGVELEAQEDQEGKTGEEAAEAQSSDTVQESAETGADAGDEVSVQQDAPPQPEMTAEDRRHSWEAKAARAEEEQIRTAAEQMRRDKIYADLFAGQVNPFTEKPILTEEDYNAYKSEREQRQQAAQLEKAGIDPGTIQSMVDQRLAPLQQRLQMAELAAMRERAMAVNARAQEGINTALRNISALDPAIHSLEDIAAMPTAPRFNELVQKGVGLEDAFYVANRQAIDARKAAARTATLNGMANRQHLDPMQNAGGKPPVEVPKEARNAYLEMFPEASEAEIQREYEAFARDLKRN